MCNRRYNFLFNFFYQHMKENLLRHIISELGLPFIFANISITQVEFQFQMSRICILLSIFIPSSLRLKLNWSYQKPKYLFSFGWIEQNNKKNYMAWPGSKCIQEACFCFPYYQYLQIQNWWLKAINSFWHHCEVSCSLVSMWSMKNSGCSHM